MYGRFPASRRSLNPDSLRTRILPDYELSFGLVCGPEIALYECGRSYMGSTYISRSLWLRRPVRNQIYEGFDSIIPN